MGLEENERSYMALISVALFRFKKNKVGENMGVNSRALGGLRTIYFNLQVTKYNELLNKT